MPDHDSILVSTLNLLGLKAAAEDLGIPIARELRSFGLGAEILEGFEGYISQTQLLNFIEYLADEYSCPHFGLLLAKHRPALGFGVLNQVIKTAPNLRAALEVGHKYLSTMTQATSWSLQVDGAVVRVVRIDLHPIPGRMQQMQMTSLGQYYRLLKALQGPDWSPEAVYFTQPQPAELQQFKRFFGAPVYFSQPFNGFQLRQADLTRSLETYDAELHALMCAHVENMGNRLEDSLPEQVTRLICQSLDTGRSSLVIIAQQMGLHPKALQRALADEGTTFKALLQRARLSTAEHFLLNSSIELTELAQLLGYSSLAAFSRGFSEATGLSPSVWRDQQMGTYT